MHLSAHSLFRPPHPNLLAFKELGKPLCVVLSHASLHVGSNFMKAGALPSRDFQAVAELKLHCSLLAKCDIIVYTIV
jgi:hypothetical protein